ncbi:DUF5983 family protein, partial [Escherichia coli]
MKLALTLEADSVNVQALNMGRIVVAYFHERRSLN